MPARRACSCSIRRAAREPSFTRSLTESERADWAYDLDGSERLGVYLTNTLEEAIKKSEILLGSYIADEANAAVEIKRAKPILVVVGNPPYSGHSANKGAWIRELVSDYAAVRPGLPKPVQGKWLQDDHIKFIRFGEWRIEQTGAGVLAFVTNHSYLDSPTFAGMRRHLMETFSDIYVLDLHGNAKKGERMPDGQQTKTYSTSSRASLSVSSFESLASRVLPRSTTPISTASATTSTNG